MIWNWLRRHPVLVDVVVVALLLLAVAGSSFHRGTHDVTGFVLGVLETVPLLWRRRFPVAVLALVTGVVVVMIAIGAWAIPFQLGLALYTVPANRDRRLASRAGFGSILAVVVAVLLTSVFSSDSDLGFSLARVVFLVAAWLLGDSLGSRRAYVREVEAKAERLEREREAHARQLVAEEQARIARELHDVVAHALSVIVIQASAADDVFDADPARTREPIRAIESAARSALGDLRRVLGLLREGAPLEPQPSLDRLEELVAGVRATGLDVSLDVEGRPRPLPAAVELSAYRIVQEALTNTLKHADASHATVRVRYADGLSLEVRDDGHGANGFGEGRGLVGMRERATMLGGTVAAGAAPDGGYVVSAELPL
jgi:signal transduction histidine kinase